MKPAIGGMRRKVRSDASDSISEMHLNYGQDSIRISSKNGMHLVFEYPFFSIFSVNLLYSNYGMLLIFGMHLINERGYQFWGTRRV